MPSSKIDILENHRWWQRDTDNIQIVSHNWASIAYRTQLKCIQNNKTANIYLCKKPTVLNKLVTMTNWLLFSKFNAAVMPCYHRWRPVRADADTARLTDMLTAFGMVQRVTGPTHRLGGLLDVVITREDYVTTDVCVDVPDVVSDHALC